MVPGATGVPVVFNGQASTTAATVPVTNSNGKPSFARALYFKNTGGTAIKLSFGGTAYLTVGAGEERNLIFTVASFIVQAASGTPTYEAIATVAA